MATFKQAPLAHGLIANIINNIPISMFIKELKFSLAFIIPIEKIITGIPNEIEISREDIDILF